MFLLCLFMAYLVVRLWEDTTATIRREPPPRHAYRMAKLAARDDAGRSVPAGSFRRYATGLLDDAWDSAHHKRELMADHRADKRARRAAAKIAKERAKWEREGTPTPAGFDAIAPEVAQAGAVPTAPTASAPSRPGSTATPAGTAHPTEATGPMRPAPGGASRSSVNPGSVGFEWTATVPETADLPPDGVPAFRKPYGPATQNLAQDLTRRYELVPQETLDKAYDDYADTRMTSEQRDAAQRWSDSLATGRSTWSMSTAQWMALPLPVRVDLLDDIRRSPTATIVSSPGEEDVEALAALALRHGGHLDPSEIYSALEDLPPAARDRVLEAQAKHQAERAATEAASATSTETADVPAAHDHTTREELSGESRTPAASASNTTTTEEATTKTSNVIPIRRPQPTPTSTTPAVATATPTRLELPMTSTEVTGLESAITYAGEMEAYCKGTFEQISAAVPNGDQAAASCEQAHANLVNGGVTGQALTDVASVQEQVVGAARELEAALAKYEQAAASAASLKSTLESHRTVQEAYNATPDAGNKEFVTTH